MNAPAVDHGPRPELTWLPVDHLDVDPAYQRTIDGRGKKLIARIAADFRWAAFQAILASPNGADRWFIIDGQHRVAAARAIGVALVPAVVVRDLDAPAQAAIVAANRGRVAVSPQALFYARLAAGDATTLHLKSLCDAAGIVLLRYSLAWKISPAGKTSAVPALLSLIRDFKSAAAPAAIAAVAACWRDRPGALRGELFHAAARFLHQGIGG